MGKANLVKVELRDVTEMVDLIQTLKDIADNKFFTLMSQKSKFRRFGETFVQFFRLISFTDAQHPLISNDYPVTGIIVITVEGSFLGEFNNKIIRLALEEMQKIAENAPPEIFHIVFIHRICIDSAIFKSSFIISSQRDYSVGKTLLQEIWL